MGSICFDFLNDSFLFNENEILKAYKDHSDENLQDELTKYRNFILSKRTDLVNDILAKKSSLKVFSTIEKIPEVTLKQSALYIDQFVIDDPLFKLGRQRNAQSSTMEEYLGYQKNSVERKSLIGIVRVLKRITPMVAADYVKLLPVSFAFEPQKNTPIYFSENYFEDQLPPNISKFCKENAIIKSMAEVKGSGWQVLRENDLTPGLFVGFGNDWMQNGMMYHYFEQEFFSTDDPTVFHAALKLAEYPMPENVWAVWAKQSINRTAINLVDKTMKEIAIATSLQSTFITDMPFTGDLINQSVESNITPASITTEHILNIEVPFIDKVDIQKLMDVRQNEQETFTNFRMELEKEFRELRFVTDAKELKERQQNIMHELGVVGVNKINTKLGSLRKKSILDGLIVIGGLAGGVASGGWSLLATAVSAASGYKSYIDYKQALNESPSYLLWKVLKK
jgi:hypothetical protein